MKWRRVFTTVVVILLTVGLVVAPVVAKGPPPHSNAGGHGPDVDHNSGGPDDSASDGNPSDSDAVNNDDTHSNGPNGPAPNANAAAHANCDNNGFDCYFVPPPSPPPPPPPPPPDGPPGPPEMCGRQFGSLNIGDTYEIYPAGAIPGVDPWLADYPAGPEALYHIRCRDAVDLYWHIEESGWEYIGRLATFGDGPEIVLDLDDLVSHLGDHYTFELPGEHVVLAGETLFSIAGRYGTTVEFLVQNNAIVDPNLILVGQVLKY